MVDKDEHKVLKDHMEQGVKYVPVILTLGQFTAVPYVRVVIPELIWFAILNHCLGYVVAAQVAQVIASTLKAASENPLWFGSISCLANVSKETKQSIALALRNKDLADSLDFALSPFLALYPEFPGDFLVGTKKYANGIEFVQEVKTILRELYDTESSTTVFMCANAVYAGFCHGFQVNECVSLSQFTEIENYPNTEVSIRVASACRSTVLMTVGKDVIDSGLTGWSTYFWNHNLQLEPIDWRVLRSQSHGR